MLVSRLVSAIEGLLRDFEHFRIMDLLNEAVSIAANRTTVNPGNYNTAANGVRQRAQIIISSSEVKKFPPDLRRCLENSKYATIIPEKIAAIVRDALPTDRERAMPSSELSLYKDAANAAINELRNFKHVTTQFNIEKIDIPANLVSIDVLISRQSFENKTGDFINILNKFSRVLSNFIELTTGSADSPKLIYTSTTDPVVAFGCVGIAATAFLKFYKLLLEVIEKQISVLQALGILKSVGLSDGDKIDADQKVSDLMISELRDGIEKLVNSLEKAVPKERANEIKNAINKDAPILAFAIADGSRVSISIEALDRIPLLADQSLENVGGVEEQLIKQKELEMKISNLRTSLNEQLLLAFLKKIEK